MNMKKIIVLLIALTVTFSVKAQWVDNPASNTFLANTSADAGEIYLSTNPGNGDTYVQWNQYYANGWSPSLQRLNFVGEPQWGPDGIHPSYHTLSSWSQGVAMTATTDNAVVTCFSTDAGQSVAIKINADGTYAWGEQGVTLFNGAGGSRTEIIAGDDGGVWTLGSDYTNLYLQYVNADGTTNPIVTISDNGGQSCMFGQMTLSNDNRVFVTYEKLGSGYYTNKQIFVAGYNTDGSAFSQETLLMSTQTFQSTYIHSALSDGMGGGYVYIWHPGIGSAFNIYVFHFNQNGATTIMDTNGTAVHSSDPSNFYLNAYATVDPDSHDIILAYNQTDASTQSSYKIYINRITYLGERVWGDGILVLNNGNIACGGLRIDAFEYGGGFSLIYHKGTASGWTSSTVEAQGFDIDGNTIWNTQMCSGTYGKTGDDNSTGFHGGQNIVAWVNNSTGGLYGQNIGQNGEMGEITPPTPPTPCYAPADFEGEAAYNANLDVSYVVYSWTAPEILPLHYNLYCDEAKDIIQIDGNFTSYYQEFEPGDYIFRLTAVYEDCESDYALTPGGDDYLLIEIIDHQSVPENTYEEIVTITEIYNIKGQVIKAHDIPELSQGLYIVKGMTSSGKTVIRKIVR